ncbi:MAG: hypothetical protein D3917_19110 [Candidatus Electrothrix sp. AX5]|nr:hypothetical protein [Candidatus Electrothrix sp. AX5]
MTTDIEIFDNSYVSETDTKADIEKKSSTKEFIQEPLLSNIQSLCIERCRGNDAPCPYGM